MTQIVSNNTLPNLSNWEKALLDLEYIDGISEDRFVKDNEVNNAIVSPNLSPGPEKSDNKPTSPISPSHVINLFNFLTGTSPAGESCEMTDSEPGHVWHGATWTDIPSVKLASVILSPDIFASYSGPDRGLAVVETEGKKLTNAVEDLQHGDNGDSIKTIAGCRSWKLKNRKAYGLAMSLYDQHPITKKMSGDPIADVFAVCARKNNAILIVADGVNWGSRSRMAARAAVYGSMTFLNRKLYTETRHLKNTQDAIRLLRESFDFAHDTIIQKEAGLTTLCIAFVCPLSHSKQYAVCCVNVGDSFAFVFSKRWGLREITVGSHDIDAERDIRDAGGALGPVKGNDPELNNLTCSMTFVDPEDVVFLTTDGISDNFDPVVTKIATASQQRRHSDGETQQDCNQPVVKPEMLPHERHKYSVKDMERLIHEFELFTENLCSAQEICGCIVQHVLVLTDEKRKVLENPNLYGRKMKSKERKRTESDIMDKMSKAAGKLDHATIVAYEVGIYRGEDNDQLNVSDETDQPPASPRYETCV